MEVETQSLNGKQVLITGVGMKPLISRFKDSVSAEDSHLPLRFGDQEFKVNIGAATAIACARAGAEVAIVGRNVDALNAIREWILTSHRSAAVKVLATDLTDANARKEMYSKLDAEKPLFWVQSLGLGAGTIKIKDDNPYLSLEDVSSEAIEAELSVFKVTAAMTVELLPRLRKQSETKICIVSSMSAVRSYRFGSLHCPAKAAISRFANAASLELYSDKIYITDIRPGYVDTGMYDSDAAREANASIGRSFGADYGPHLPLASPATVASLILNVLTLPLHITSINMVARGQEPHEGS